MPEDTYTNTAAFRAALLNVDVYNEQSREVQWWIEYQKEKRADRADRGMAGFITGIIGGIGGFMVNGIKGAERGYAWGQGIGTGIHDKWLDSFDEEEFLSGMIGKGGKFNRLDMRNRVEEELENIDYQASADMVDFVTDIIKSYVKTSDLEDVGPEWAKMNIQQRVGKTIGDFGFEGLGDWVSGIGASDKKGLFNWMYRGGSGLVDVSQSAGYTLPNDGYSEDPTYGHQTYDTDIDTEYIGETEVDYTTPSPSEPGYSEETEGP